MPYLSDVRLKKVNAFHAIEKFFKPFYNLEKKKDLMGPKMYA